MIQTNCPHCGAHNEIPEEYIGHEVTCPSCGGDYKARRLNPSIPKGGHLPKIPEEQWQESVNKSAQKNQAAASQRADHNQELASARKLLMFVAILMVLFFITFVYVNRTLILDLETESGIDPSAVFKVRQISQNWEYKIEEFDVQTRIEKNKRKDLGPNNHEPVFRFSDYHLDRLGEEGWELIAVDQEKEIAVFKRTKRD